MAPIAVEKEPIVEAMPVLSSKKIKMAATVEDAYEMDKVRSSTKLPVTLLSGFLGAGKTTLLERILTSDHGYRVGVIVNDMGALNIDAALLANHKVHQEQERVVEMQNGCICCTLRGDLLEEVARLAEEGNVDYLVIESSGISEPMQVAETFSEEFAEMHQQAGMDLVEEMRADVQSAKRNAKVAEILQGGGLSRISRLDTCVTMVDAVNVFNDFHTADFLADRHGKDDVPEEDDRNVSDLQTDQIEFANVVIINKCDLVPKEEVDKIRHLIKTLNPDAKILTSVKARVDVGQLLNTRLFDYEKAALGAGWLRSLREEVKPETEEYGIGSFVYRARRPFHPQRLWELIKNNFVVIQEEYIDDGMDEDGEEDGSENDGDDDDDGEEEAMEVDDEKQPQLNPKARLEAKKANPTFAPLLRSKGFFWLATRPSMFGEWSQAGVMLTLTGGDQWRCEVPKSEWPQDEDVHRAILNDFQGEWGDRRQEIVLIGLEMSNGGRERLERALNGCLLHDDEWQAWEKVMRKKWGEEKKKKKLEELFDDGFEDWQLHHDEEDGADGHHGHNHGPSGHHHAH